MYLNLIYVYLVTNGKMPFQWETNSICQHSVNIIHALSIASRCRSENKEGGKKKPTISIDGVKWRQIFALATNVTYEIFLPTLPPAACVKIFPIQFTSG